MIELSTLLFIPHKYVEIIWPNCPLFRSHMQQPLTGSTVTISKRAFLRLNRSRMSIFAHELAVLVFTKEGLAQSTLTGGGLMLPKCRLLQVCNCFELHVLCLKASVISIAARSHGNRPPVIIKYILDYVPVAILVYHTDTISQSFLMNCSKILWIWYVTYSVTCLFG